MASDGKVTISTALDNSGIEKGLQEVNGEFGGLQETVKETGKAIDKAFDEAGGQKVKLTGFQYDSAEIGKFVDEYVSGLNEVEKHSNEMKAAFEAAQKKVEDLEEQGFWWGDEDYEKAYAALDRIQKDIQEAQHFATAQPKSENPFGLDTLSGKIQELKNRLASLTEAGKGLGTQEYDEAYAALAKLTQEAKEYKRALTETAIPPGLDTYEGKIISLENELRNLRNAGKGLGDPAYDEIYRKLALAKNEAKKYAAELAKVPNRAKRSAKETNRITKSAQKAKKEFGAMSRSVNSFASRLKSIAAGALLFNGISAGLREFTSYLGKSLKTNKDFAAELSRLKGALLTAFQPIYNVVTPIVTDFMSLLTDATLVVAEFFASVTGTTVEANAEAAKELYEEANALETVEEAAKKTGKALAGFDEINVLRGESESSNTTKNTEINMPDFSVIERVDTGEFNRLKSVIKEIAEYIPVIAAALGGWKLGSFVADLLTANIEAKTLKETIALLGKKAGLTVGITLAVTGLATEIKGISDVIQEGLNGINFAEIIGGGGALAGGGALIGKFFGNAIIGGAVGAIVGGVGAVFAGIYDACVNGIDWLSAALTAIGTTAMGAGIGALIGSAGGPLGALIGLAVGLVTDLVILIVQKWDEICAFFAPAVEWFDINIIQPVAGFFTGLWEGISSAASNCWNAIVEFFTPAFEWFSELFGSIWQTISDIFYNIGVIASGCWDVIQAVWGIVSSWFNENVIQPVAEFFTGLWNGFVEKAKAAWEGVKTVFSKVASFFSEIFSKAWQGIVKVFSVAGEIFVDIKDGILTAFKFVVNGIIKGLNSAIAVPFNGINWALEKIKSIEIVGITPFSGLKTISVPQIPYLAQGAVLPPNKPFMAIVGDQRHGTNIEAPLTTIQEAVALVMQDQTSAILAGFEASVGIQKEILEAVLGIQIGDDVIGQAAARYNRKMAAARGGV